MNADPAFASSDCTHTVPYRGSANSDVDRTSYSILVPLDCISGDEGYLYLGILLSERRCKVSLRLVEFDEDLIVTPSFDSIEGQPAGESQLRVVRQSVQLSPKFADCDFVAAHVDSSGWLTGQYSAFALDLVAS